jgi:hypothetical protein
MSFNYADYIGSKRWNGRTALPEGLNRVRISLLLLIFTAITLGSCHDKLESFKIQRVPVFSFSFDDLNKETASDAKFTRGKQSLHHYPTGETELYTRCLMQVNGTNKTGNKYIISIEFETIQRDSLIGIFRTDYVPGIGGIYSFTYLEEVSPNTYKSYLLDPAALNETYFRIQKQNKDEKLILGDFFAKLQNDQDPAEKLIFYQGTFIDIYYALQ